MTLQSKWWPVTWVWATATQATTTRSPDTRAVISSQVTRWLELRNLQVKSSCHFQVTLKLKQAGIRTIWAFIGHYSVQRAPKSPFNRGFLILSEQNLQPITIWGWQGRHIEENSLESGHFRTVSALRIARTQRLWRDRRSSRRWNVADTAIKQPPNVQVGRSIGHPDTILSG